MPADYLERSKQILEYLRDNGSAKAEEVASALGVSHSNISGKLARFATRNWVSREKDHTHSRGRAPYIYEIRSDGVDKLEYWEEEDYF